MKRLLLVAMLALLPFAAAGQDASGVRVDPRPFNNLLCSNSQSCFESLDGSIGGSINTIDTDGGEATGPTITFNGTNCIVTSGSGSSVTVDGSLCGGGGGGHTIQSEGVGQTDRANLNFEGDAVEFTDDVGGDASSFNIELVNETTPVLGGPLETGRNALYFNTLATQDGSITSSAVVLNIAGASGRAVILASEAAGLTVAGGDTAGASQSINILTTDADDWITIGGIAFPTSTETTADRSDGKVLAWSDAKGRLEWVVQTGGGGSNPTLFADDYVTIDVAVEACNAAGATLLLSGADYRVASAPVVLGGYDTTAIGVSCNVIGVGAATCLQATACDSTEVFAGSQISCDEDNGRPCFRVVGHRAGSIRDVMINADADGDPGDGANDGLQILGNNASPSIPVSGFMIDRVNIINAKAGRGIGILRSGMGDMDRSFCTGTSCSLVGGTFSATWAIDTPSAGLSTISDDGLAGLLGSQVVAGDFISFSGFAGPSVFKNGAAWEVESVTDADTIVVYQNGYTTTNEPIVPGVEAFTSSIDDQVDSTNIFRGVISFVDVGIWDDTTQAVSQPVHGTFITDFSDRGIVVNGGQFDIDNVGFVTSPGADATIDIGASALNGSITNSHLELKHAGVEGIRSDDGILTQKFARSISGNNFLIATGVAGTIIEAINWSSRGALDIGTNTFDIQPNESARVTVDAPDPDNGSELTVSMSPAIFRKDGLGNGNLLIRWGTGTNFINLGHAGAFGTMGTEETVGKYLDLKGKTFQAIDRSLLKQTYYFRPYSGSPTAWGTSWNDAIGGAGAYSILKALTNAYVHLVVDSREPWFSSMMLDTDGACAFVPGEVATYGASEEFSLQVIDYDPVSQMLIPEILVGPNPQGSDNLQAHGCTAQLDGDPINTVGDSGSAQPSLAAEARDAEAIVTLLESSDPARPWGVHCNNTAPQFNGVGDFAQGFMLGLGNSTGKLGVANAVISNCPRDAKSQQGTGRVAYLNVSGINVQNFNRNTATRACSGVVNGTGQYHVGETVTYDAAANEATVVGWNHADRWIGLAVTTGVCPDETDVLTGVTSGNTDAFTKVWTASNNQPETTHGTGGYTSVNGEGSNFQRADAVGGTIAPTASSYMTMITEGTYYADSTGLRDSDGSFSYAQDGADVLIYGANMLGTLTGGFGSGRDGMNMQASAVPATTRFVRTTHNTSADANHKCLMWNPTGAGGHNLYGWQVTCADAVRGLFLSAPAADSVVSLKGVIFDNISQFSVISTSEGSGVVDIEGSYDDIETAGTFFSVAGGGFNTQALYRDYLIAQPGDWEVFENNSGNLSNGSAFTGGLDSGYRCDEPRNCWQSYNEAYVVPLPTKGCLEREYIGQRICSLMLNPWGGNRGAH